MLLADFLSTEPESTHVCLPCCWDFRGLLPSLYQLSPLPISTLLGYFETVSHNSTLVLLYHPGSPAARCVDQADLEFTEILLAQSPKCWGYKHDSFEFGVPNTCERIARLLRWLSSSEKICDSFLKTDSGSLWGCERRDRGQQRGQPGMGCTVYGTRLTGSQLPSCA